MAVHRGYLVTPRPPISGRMCFDVRGWTAHTRAPNAFRMMSGQMRTG